MTLPVFYAPALSDRPHEPLRLGSDEAKHVRSLRLRVGDAVVLADGKGGRWRAVLTETDRSGTVCRVAEPLPDLVTPPVDLLFGVANRERTLWLVEKAVELGVRSLVPYESSRTASVADAARSPAFRERITRRAVAAMKQSGGGALPVLEAPRSFDDVIARLRDGPGLLLDSGAAATVIDRLRGWDAERPAALLVGPEGGLTPDEAEAASERGFKPAALGSRTLRFETAAVAAVAIAVQAATGGTGADLPEEDDGRGTTKGATR